jgi:hypothetical protein
MNKLLIISNINSPNLFMLIVRGLSSYKNTKNNFS